MSIGGPLGRFEQALDDRECERLLVTNDAEQRRRVGFSKSMGRIIQRAASSMRQRVDDHAANLKLARTGEIDERGGGRERIGIGRRNEHERQTVAARQIGKVVRSVDMRVQSPCIFDDDGVMLTLNFAERGRNRFKNWRRCAVGAGCVKRRRGRAISIRRDRADRKRG